MLLGAVSLKISIYIEIDSITYLSTFSWNLSNLTKCFYAFVERMSFPYTPSGRRAFYIFITRIDVGLPYLQKICLTISAFVAYTLYVI